LAKFLLGKEKAGKVTDSFCKLSMIKRAGYYLRNGFPA
jgi:hypothetical protein